MYRPGAAFRELSAGSPVVALPALARPHLEWLSRQVGETVNLVTRTGRDIRFVESVEGAEVLRIGSRVGVVLPAHRTSGGKVLLADLSRTELEAVYPHYPAG